MLRFLKLLHTPCNFVLTVWRVAQTIISQRSAARHPRHPYSHVSLARYGADSSQQRMSAGSSQNSGKWPFDYSAAGWPIRCVVPLAPRVGNMSQSRLSLSLYVLSGEGNETDFHAMSSETSAALAELKLLWKNKNIVLKYKLGQ